MKKTKKLFIALTLIMIMTFGFVTTICADGVEVTTAVITSIPVFETGKTIADAKAEATVDGGTVETQWLKWSEADEDYVAITDAEAVFEESGIYNLRVVIKPSEGNTFSETFSFEYAEGVEPVSEWGEMDENDVQTFWCADFGMYTFRKQINEIAITTPQVKAGDIASMEGIEVKLYANDEEIPVEELTFEAKWLDEFGTEEVDGTELQAESLYQINMTLTAGETNCFANDPIVTVNGVENFGFFSPMKIDAAQSISMYTPVEKFELSGLSNVRAGVALADAITLENDMNGTCELSVEWYDEEENPIIEEEFIAGKNYLMNLNVYLTNGGTVSEDLILIIDGKEYIPDTIYADEGQIYTMITCEAGAASENLIPMIVFGVIGVAIVVDVIMIIRAMKKRKKDSI